jgi:hypothetical protein
MTKRPAVFGMQSITHTANTGHTHHHQAGAAAKCGRACAARGAAAGQAGSRSGGAGSPPSAAPDPTAIHSDDVVTPATDDGIEVTSAPCRLVRSG